MKEIKSVEEFNEFIMQDWCLVDLYAQWCVPCKNISKLIETIEEEIPVAKLDVDVFSDLITNYRVVSIPTLFIFSNGEVKKQVVGNISLGNLKDFIKR